MKIRNTILVLLCSAMSCIGFAQVSFTYQVTNATCSSNGSIVVNATGGTGTLNYQLTGTCLNLPLVQQSPSFNNLAPCSYQLTVTDGASGASASQTVVVGGNYQSPDISLFCGSCSIETQLTGGLGPFAYSISSVGLSGPFTNNSPASNPSFDNILSGTNYWVKVTDACGNVSVETCQTGEGSLADFNYEVGADGNLHTISIIGGNGNLEYTLSSSVGTFSNQTGVFSPAQWGCNMTLTLSDGCTSLTKSVVIRPKILSICSNFAEGTATLENVIYGVPPYTFRYIFPDNSTVINSPTNELTGLPINSNFYLFQVVDACGNGSDGIFKQKKYPVFEQAPPADCNGNSISLFTPESGCGGGFDADSWPFEVTCQTCSPIVTQQVNGAGIPITFTGNAPGNWELAIEDGCEDKMVCRDSVILLLEKRCDSIYATLIDRFTCDNGAVSDRPLSAANGLFTLLDANENVVSTNMTGEFHVPDSGDYKVLLNIQGCGSYEASTSVGHWQPIEPEMSIYIYNAILANQCKTVYQLIISREDGPYLLTGGPNNITMLLDENDLTGSCQQYSVTGLLPGSYQLSEIDKCGFRMLDLPAPDYNLVAEPFGNCPGSGTITVSGAQNLAQWQAWGELNNIDISWPNSITDNYALDAPTNGALTAQSGSPFTFVNVAAGEHTVYLYTLNSQCAIDTAIVFVPEADTLSFDVSSGILCDGASTTTLHFEVLSGKPPYVIEQVDCSNPAQVIATHQLSDDSFALPGFGIGDYCFRIIDSCITSLDHQFSVQYFQDDIDVAFNCDNTFSLSVDSLNANYSWVDENGNEVGNTHRITLPNTGLVASFSVFVDIGECIIERKITVPATEIIPTIEIQGASFFCAGETVELTAVASAASLLWNNAAISTTITTSMPGTYAATVTNGFGCTATDSFSLSLDLPLIEIEIMSGGNGFGLNCFQDSNGMLRANPIIGIPPFTYEWSSAVKTQRPLRSPSLTFLCHLSISSRPAASGWTMATWKCQVGAAALAM
ncbi:MAG: SprB repeat-containing protein [Saprospiraceae bacterium]|nr:SprB repeat-containing protein [Saprospiraceae bacterium]